MKKIFIPICTLILLATSAYATEPTSNPIVTAVPALSITPDARSGGMGDIGAATTPDANSQFWNPAKYVFMESEAGLSVNYTPWLRKLVSDIDLTAISGYYKFDQNQSVSASIRYFSLGDIQMTDYSGSPLYTAKPNEYSIDIAYSRLFSDKFSGAATLRYIRTDLGNGTQTDEMTAGSTVAADIAAYYKTPVTLETMNGNLALGLNISNLGGKISYSEGESYFIPTNMKLGASFEYPIDQYNKLSISGDANKLLVPTPDPTKEASYYFSMSPITGIMKSFSDAPGGAKEELQEITWSLGAEYCYNNQFFVRGGYFHESQYKGNRKYFTAGAGFKLNIFQLDAGYVISVAQSNPLDQTLRLSFSFDLFGLKNLVK